MRSREAFLILFLLCGIVSSAQPSTAQAEASAATQTARQALLEMFFSKTPGTIMKHLPLATRAALEKAGTVSKLSQYATFTSQLQAQQNNLETFETGSILLSAIDPKAGTKIEVIVENDALRGDQDDIELSFQTYKNGEAQRTPFMPHLTFSMKTEAGIWKLNEISITVHLPLADPDLLKTISDTMNAQAARPISASRGAITTSTAGNDTAVVTSMRSILAAENTYATTYRSVGYTCTLSDLDGFGGGERNEHQAMLINSGLAGGKRFGYVFTLSQCGGIPASSFHLTAAPSGNAFGRHMYCADQTGTVRYSADGNPASCFINGIPFQ
jgi:hypothetical protein